MALILDLITELETAETLEAERVAGGSDLLDTQVGASTLTPETVAALAAKLAHETLQLQLIGVALSALNGLVANGYPERKVFDVLPAVTEELTLKQKQMLDFANELRPIVLGSDGGVITVVEPAIAEPAAKKKK